MNVYYDVKQVGFCFDQNRIPRAVQTAVIKIKLIDWTVNFLKIQVFTKFRKIHTS